MLLFSCQKSGNGYVRGTITEGISNNNLEGVFVYLIRETREAKGQSYVSYDTIARTTTNINGYYKLKYHKSSGWQHNFYVNCGYTNTYKNGNHQRKLDYKKSVVNFTLY